MRTRHLVGLISGVLILSVLLPVGLSIWLAHQQVETSFIEELDTFKSEGDTRGKTARMVSRALDEMRSQGRFSRPAASKRSGWPAPFLPHASAMPRLPAASTLTQKQPLSAMARAVRPPGRRLTPMRLGSWLKGLTHAQVATQSPSASLAVTRHSVVGVSSVATSLP